MKNGTECKLKFKQLQRRLKLPLWQARGLLDTLWQFVATNCPTGDVGRFTNEEIAVGIDWQDDPDELVAALTSCRWLDVCDDRRRLIVHDWPEHCEHEVHKQLAKKAEAFADGTLPSLSRLTREERPEIIDKLRDKYGEDALKRWNVYSAPERQETLTNAHERPETFLGVQETPQPCLALPSQALPSQQEHSCIPETANNDRNHDLRERQSLIPGVGVDDPPEKRRARHVYSESFEQWYSAYPRREAKGNAAKAYAKAVKHLASHHGTSREQAHEWLVQITKTYAASIHGQAGEFVPHPATWLNGHRYFDDPAEWNRPRVSVSGKDYS